MQGIDLRLLVEKELKGISLFGLEHVERVAVFSTKLVNALPENEKNIDLEVLEAALLLHDIGVPFWLAYKQDHLGFSIAKAKTFLEKVDFPLAKRDAVLHCIQEHHWRGKPATIEAKLLHDSNLLDNIGAMGVLKDSIKCYLNGLNAFQSVNYFSVKANYLDGAFSLGQARQLALEGIAFYKTFSQSLEKSFK